MSDERLEGVCPGNALVISSWPSLHEYRYQSLGSHTSENYSDIMTDGQT